jgi:4-amino-4-deoxy-L-arabinose transferase-like glycosyltransferase
MLTNQERNVTVRWLLDHKLELVFLALLILLAAIRGYWAPDEPDFAQCIKEMRREGHWLFPYLNGAIYTEKPILFYWLMKLAASTAEWLSGGLGFSRGIAPWALRIPSILSAFGLLVGTKWWVRRFLAPDSSDLSVLILATTPIWIWQGQFIQIDMVFSVLLAWSWMTWYAGYSIQKGLIEVKGESEAKRWFIGSSAALGLATLAKGPLALVLSMVVILSFLWWQDDMNSIRRDWLFLGLAVSSGVILPWYLFAGFKNGPHYLYFMVVHQNFERAVNAWDHVQPWWRYCSYLAADFFPWSLLVPVALVTAFRHRATLSASSRFTLVASLVPFVLLSLSKSKQGKYILMIYPFLAVLISSEFSRVNHRSRETLRRTIGALYLSIGVALWVVGLTHLGGPRLHTQFQSFLGPLRLSAFILSLGGGWLWIQKTDAVPPRLLTKIAIPVAALCLLVIPWTMAILDPAKDYKSWARATEPLLADRQVYFWGDIRSGAMIYSDRMMPVITTPNELQRLGPEDRLIVTDRRWKAGIDGLDATCMGHYKTIYHHPQGGDGLQVLAPN